LTPPIAPEHRNRATASPRAYLNGGSVRSGEVNRLTWSPRST